MQSTAQAPAKMSLNLFDIASPPPGRPARSVQGIFARHTRSANGNLGRACSKQAGSLHETMRANLPAQLVRAPVLRRIAACQRKTYRPRIHAHHPPMHIFAHGKLAKLNEHANKTSRSQRPRLVCRQNMGCATRLYRGRAGRRFRASRPPAPDTLPAPRA